MIFKVHSRWLISIFAFIFLSVSASNTVNSQEPTPRERLHEIEDYVVFYGVGGLDVLLTYDLAIIQTGTLTPDELAILKESGVIVVAYLSIGEAEPYRPWFDRVDQEWVLGENGNWGSLFVDASQAGWQALMLEQAGLLLDEGFDGIFLDTVDTVDAFPETQAGMESLITQLRTTYPEAIMIQNRGFTVLPTTSTIIDGLMFEGLTTGYNFQSDTYIRTTNQALAESLQELQEETGIVILALDYAQVDDVTTQAAARAAAEAFGFISAVAEITLQILIPRIDPDLPLPVVLGTPPQIIFAGTQGTCPLVEGVVSWQDADADIIGIEASWGSHAAGTFAHTYTVISEDGYGLWTNPLHLSCVNDIGGGCYYQFRAVDRAGNWSQAVETYHICQ